MPQIRGSSLTYWEPSARPAGQEEGEGKFDVMIVDIGALEEPASAGPDNRPPRNLVRYGNGDFDFGVFDED